MTAPLGEWADDGSDLPWRPWTPAELAGHLGGTHVRWAVAGGWAVDLFLGRITRDHEDLEIVIPAADTGALLGLFAGPQWTWRIPSEGALLALQDDSLARTRQTWLWSADADAFVLDVFRNLHRADTWVCHRDEAITAPWRDVVATTAAGIPFLVPEVVLLYKAKHQRAKDVADLESALPALGAEARARLRRWLEQVHPDHPWLARLG